MTDINSTPPPPAIRSEEVPKCIAERTPQDRAQILRDAERNLQRAVGLLLIADNVHAQGTGALEGDVSNGALAELIEDIEDRIRVALRPPGDPDHEFSQDDVDRLCEVNAVLYCVRALILGPEGGADGIMPPWRSNWAGPDSCSWYLIKAARELVAQVLETVAKDLATEGMEVANG